MKQKQKSRDRVYPATRGNAIPKSHQERRANQSVSDLKLYLSNPEAAEYLGVSESFLNKTRHFGTGPRFRRAGRLIKYLVEDLDDWLAEGSATSTRDYVKRGP